MNSLKWGGEALCAIDSPADSVPQLPRPDCAISLLFQSLAETERWIEAIWLKVNPDKAEAILLGRGRQSWRTGRQRLLHLLKDLCPFLSKSFVNWCSPSPEYPNSSNVWKCSLSFFAYPRDHLFSLGSSRGCVCCFQANLRMQALPWATLEGCLEASSSAEHSCPSSEQGKLAGAYHTCAPCSELAAKSLLGSIQDWLNIDKAGNELSSD